MAKAKKSKYEYVIEQNIMESIYIVSTINLDIMIFQDSVLAIFKLYLFQKLNLGTLIGNVDVSVVILLR